MPNISSALARLDSVATRCATPEQKVFINQLIKSILPHVRRPIFSKEFLLEERLLFMKKLLGRELSQDEISQAIDEIAAMRISGKTLGDIYFEVKEELRKYPSSSEYTNALLMTLYAIQVHLNKKLDLSRKDINDFLDPIAYDQMYHRTIHEFNGSVMLPMQMGAGVDHRMGDDPGQCFGFVAVWAKAWLDDKAPFGIQPTQAPPFNIVPFQSKTTNIFPDINNLVTFTPQVAQLQRAQVSSSIFDAFNLKTKNSRGRTYFHKSAEIVEKLIQVAEKNPNGVYNLNIWQYDEGHSFGFKKDNKGNYHFLDGNGAWFRFNNANDFTKWFCFYCRVLSYNKHIEYSIMNFQHKPKNVQNAKTTSETKLSNVVNLFLKDCSEAIKLTRMLIHNFYRYIRNSFEGKPSGNNESNPQSSAPTYKAVLNVLDTNQTHTINICPENKAIAMATDEEKRNFDALDLAPAAIRLPPSNTKNLKQDALDLAVPSSLRFPHP